MQILSSLTTLKAVNIIVVLGLVVFFNSLNNGFIGDDQTQILENPAVHSVGNIFNFFGGSTFYNGDINNLQGLYYRPLMSAFYSVLYSVGGPNPLIFHLFQVTLHIVNAVIVYLVLKRFLRPYFSLFGALIFLIHPLNSETISYIANLQDVLFFFFGILAFYFYLRMKSGVKKVLVIVGLLLLSLFSKETGALFAGVILLHAILINKKAIKVAVLAVVLVSSIYTFFRFVLAQVAVRQDSFAPIMEMSFAERLHTIPSVILYYIKTAFFPLNLAVSQQWLITEDKLSELYLSIIAVLIFIVILFAIGNYISGKQKKYLSAYIFFTSWYLVGILFHSHIFFTLDNTVADRWMYFSIIGLIGSICILLQMSFNKLSKSFQLWFALLLIFILILFSYRTVLRNANFYDNYTLYSHDITYSQDSSLLHNGLGYELMKQQRFKEAEPHLLKSVALDPKGSINWNTLAVFYERTNQIEKAERAYKTAIKNQPYYAAYQNYALFLLLNNKMEKAEVFTRDALKKFPTNGFLWQVYTLVEHELGNGEEAKFAAEKAATYYPSELSYIINNRLSQNLSLEVSTVQTANGKVLHVCPPECN